MKKNLPIIGVSVIYGIDLLILFSVTTFPALSVAITLFSGFGIIYSGSDVPKKAKVEQDQGPIKVLHF